MARKRVLSLRCPTCEKLVLRTDPEFPFCSQRCRLIDLGKWASGAYVVRGASFDPEQVEPSGPMPSPAKEDDGGSHGTPGKPH